MMKPIILIGAGGHCVSCIDVIEQGGIYKILGILDLPEKKGMQILGYPVIGSDNDILTFLEKCSDFHITVGQISSTVIREKIYSKIISAGGYLPVIISPRAHVSKHAVIGAGTIVMHDAIVNAGASVGLCCILNTKSLIEHEAEVGSFCHISTASVINGQVKIGEKSFIGSNSVIANNLVISGETIVAAGSQVLKNIETKGTYIGHPLRKVKP